MDNIKQNRTTDLILNENTLPIIEQISEGMPGGFFIYHADGAEELIYINHAMLRIFGCESLEEFKELTNYTFPGLVHPDDIDEIEQSIKKQIQNSNYDLDFVEYRIIQKDGSVRWVEDYGHFMHTETYGDIFYVFIEDATERLKKRMNDLEEINEELRTAYIRESQYKKAILYDAIAFFEINLTRDEFISTSLHMFDDRIMDLFEVPDVPVFEKYSDYVDFWQQNINPDETDAYQNFFDVDRMIRCYMKGELEQTYNSWIVDKIGRKRLVQYLFLLGRNDFTGDVIALSIAKDITEQTEKQNLLQVALQQAQTAHVARNTFLSNMSHDIRTPLNAIIGYTELIKKYITDTERVDTYLKQIRSSSEQLLAIVNESLEITRIESGKANLMESECYLTDLLEDVKKTILPSVVKREIQFNLNMTNVRKFAVVADYIRLREILCQILDNAIKYSHKGGMVSLIVEEEDIELQRYGKYRFTIEDHGIGISEDFMKYLFDPFKRERNTTKSGVHGTGLGLAVVKCLVDMMEGEMDVRSEVGKGTQFTIQILLKQQEDQSLKESMPPDAVLKESELVGRRILLVEDNAVNCEISEELLKTEGYLVDTAENGLAAYEMVRRSEPGYYSLILMDIQMPVMDGYEATKRIRELPSPELSHIPIIALSANAFAEDYQKSLDAGMNAHFPKPIDIKGLQELILHVLSLERNQ